MKDKFISDQEQLLPELIKIRTHLHKYPELSFQESQTGQFIQSKLNEWNIPFECGFAGNGIVATLDCAHPTGQYLYIRADMDALPITEVMERAHRSVNEGVMHACGHDVHMTCLLGAIRLIQSYQDKLPVSVKCIFQPGEEKLPGGATLMLAEGAVKPKEAVGIIALHVYPDLETGTIGFHPGPYMASADELYIEVIGKGGHAATPHLCVDPILVSAELISRMQELISRNKNPLVESVLTIGKINSVGGATNIIPDKVLMEGTFRSLNEEWRNHVLANLPVIAQSLGDAHGAQIKVHFVKGYPVLVNNLDLTEKVISSSKVILGEDNVLSIDKRMTAEDFAWYAQEIPACFFRLGTGNTKLGITASVHTPAFDVDEKCLSIGAGLLAWAALNFNK